MATIVAPGINDTLLAGTSSNDYLYGNAGKDTLLGYAGDDYLSGAVGSDSMVGGTGNDTYLIDGISDIVVEYAGEGTDTVQVPFSLDLNSTTQLGGYLGNIENFVLSGLNASFGIGNAASNSIMGSGYANTLDGGAGNDTIDGNGGNDTIYGGLGNDSLLGDVGNDSLMGDTGSDSLSGGSGNDCLIGGVEADYMTGGAGNDSYSVDNTGDVVSETTNQGTDIIYSSVNYTIPANVEGLVLRGQLTATGWDNLNATGGNATNDSLVGNAGNNILTGLGENDTLMGGEIIKSTNGNNDDTLGGNDTLLGGDGNDSLIGGPGVDSLIGGLGNDTYEMSYDYRVAVNDTAALYALTTDKVINGDYVYQNNPSNPALSKLWQVVDQTNLGNIAGYKDTGRTGTPTWLATVKLDVGTQAELLALTPAQVSNGDYVRQFESTPGGASIVYRVIDQTQLGNLALGWSNTGATGVKLAVNTTAQLLALTTLDVSNGDYVRQFDPTLPLGGASILYKVIDQTQLSNLALGWSNTGATGMPSALESTDVIVEGATRLTDGIDLVKSSATFNLAINGANVENLTLIGSDNVSGYGNSTGAPGTVGNVLTGNVGSNSLFGGAGDDTLDGSFGTDTLIGGAGNDYYILSSETEDTTIEAPGGGIDTVQSSVNFSLLARPTFSQINNLVLTGTAILGKGNALDNKIFGYTMDDRLTPAGLPYTPSNDNRLTLATDNQLSGGAGNDSLYGGLGSDLLDGGVGNDMLIGGTNTIFGGASTLPGGLDTDTLNGNDQLLGGDGSDSLDGGFGNDILKGGHGGGTILAPTGVGDLLLGGAGNDLLLGGTNATAGATDRDLISPNDTLLGGTGNDTLDGGLGVNSLMGGLGDDLVYVRSAADIAIELPGEGNDTLIANFNLDLSATSKYANFENAALFGNANIDLTGNDDPNNLAGNNGANVIIGNGGNDTISGGAGLDYLWGDDVVGTIAGNDCLDGGSSASPSRGDTMDGGQGNDTYVADNINDQVMESQLADDGGVDTVKTYVNFDPLPGRGDPTYPNPNGDPNNVTRANSFASLDPASFARLENFVLLDDSLIGTSTRGVGNALGNEFTGNAEANIILGLGGDDTILGGAGNDSLFGDADYGDPATQPDRYAVPAVPIYDSLTGAYPSNPGAYANAVAGLQDVDPFGDLSVPLTTAQVQSLIDPTYGTVINPAGPAVEGYFDSLVGGDGNDVLSGGGGEDTLLGGNGNDCLVGGIDADSMLGGAGNDTFFIDNFADAVVEQSSEGIDQLRSTVDIYRLQDNVENLTIYGSVATLGQGNDLDNVIDVAQLGASGPYVSDIHDVTLQGGLGNDRLLGFSDWMVNKTEYVQRTADDYLLGGAGNDWLDGGLDNAGDILEGGLGNDTLVVDSPFDKMLEFNNEGTDLVVTTIDLALSDTSVAQGMFVENLTLFDGTTPGVTGFTPFDGSGNRLNNFITGNANNNLLDGLMGMDTILGDVGEDCIQGGLYLGIPFLDDGASDCLVGGNQNDTYQIQFMDTLIGPNQAADVIFDSGGARDLIESSVSYSLMVMDGYKVTGIEDLTLTGTGNNFAIGDTGANILTGNSGDNFILGLDGDDTINGMAGDDDMYGGANNDIMHGGTGADTFSGGTGDDTFVFDDNQLDIVSGGKDTDLIKFDIDSVTLVAADFANVTTVEALTVKGGTNNIILADGTGIVSLTGGSGLDTFDASLSTKGMTIIGNSGNDILTGGTGDDSITGDSGADFLDGGAGVDTLIGGAGNDTFIGRQADVVMGGIIDGGDGVDTVQTSDMNFSLKTSKDVERLELLGAVGLEVFGNDQANLISGTNTADLVGVPGDTIIGAGGNDTLYGNAGNDCLVGGADVDQLYGGSGNDSLVIDAFDAPSAGGVVDGGLDIDEVQVDFTFSLDSSAVISVENLRLTGTTDINGTGDSNDNVITGNSGNNSLDGGVGSDSLYGGGGKDTLTGGGGIDQLFGEAGNDVLVVDAADTVIDGGVGVDVVNADFSFSLASIGVVNVENLTLTGAGNFNGTGDAFNNIITGNDGNNILDGGVGVDQLIGGAGNDTLVVDAADIAFDGGAGQDWISASFDFDLTTGATSVENLILTNTAIKGTGAADANNIIGNDNDNVLNGLDGNDALVGGKLNDILDGGAGNDRILGTNPVAQGAGEIDTLTGGAGADVFVLGDETNVFYAAASATEYAVIKDFDMSQTDTLELKLFPTVPAGPGGVPPGNVSGYYIDNAAAAGVGVGNSRLWYDVDSSGGYTVPDMQIASIQAKGGSGPSGGLTTIDLATVGTFV